MRPAPVAVGKRGELEQAAVRRGPLLVGRRSGAGVGAAGGHGSGSPPPPRSHPAGGGHGGGDRILLLSSGSTGGATRGAQPRPWAELGRGRGPAAPSGPAGGALRA